MIQTIIRFRYAAYAAPVIGALMFLGSALPVQAASLTSAQVSAVVNLLQSFGVDSQTIANVESALGDTTVITNPALPCNCPNMPVEDWEGSGASCSCSSGGTPPTTPVAPCNGSIGQNLSVGMTGSNVVALQNLLGVNATGYFGTATQAAVVQWQSEHNLPATGYVGPMTRSAFGSWCGGGGYGNVPPPASGFTGSPTSGTAPLTVSFTDPSGLTVGSSYIITYGDGSNSGPITATGCAMPMTSGMTTDSNYGCLGSVTHTYTSTGSYTATLSPYIACIYATPVHCDLAVQSIGSVTITVSGATLGGSIFSATPTSGPAPLAVYFRSSVDGTVNFGDGQTGTMSEVYPPCASSVANCGPFYQISHTYTAAYTYTATLDPACSGGVACLAPQQVTITTAIP